MKKICLLVMLALLTSNFTFICVNADHSNNIFNKKAVEVLKNLEIQIDEVNINEIMTRGEFVHYVMKIMKYDFNGLYTSLSPFADVDESMEFYHAILGAVELGIIDGSVNLFNPREGITFIQSSKILVELLGYGNMVSHRGGYPYGYFIISNEIGLYRGLSAVNNAVITKGQAYTLMFNALNAEYIENTSTQAGRSTQTKGSLTVMEGLYGVELIRGIVDAVEYYGLNGKSGVGKNNISIDGVIYNSVRFDANLYFGNLVDAYVKYEKDGVEATVISLSVRNDEDDMTIYSDNLISYSDRKIKYMLNDKTYHADISVNADIFYNGRPFEFDINMFLPDTGYIKLIENNSSQNGYDVVIIKSYENFVVESKVTRDYVIIDKYTSGKSITLNPNNRHIKIVDLNGDILNFNGLLIDDVLAISASIDGEVIEVIVVRDSVYGTITGKGDNSLYVDGREYKLSNRHIDNLVKIGDSYVLKFDMVGDIAHVIPDVTGTYRIGYIMHGKLFEQGLQKYITLKMFDADNKVNEYRVANIVTVNGVFYKNPQQAIENSEMRGDSNTDVKKSVVLFSLNDKHEINYIDYPSDKIMDIDGNSKLYKTGYVEDGNNNRGIYDQYNKYVGAFLFVDPTSVRLRVPRPSPEESFHNDETFYAATQFQSLSHNTSHNKHSLTGYTSNKNSKVSEFILAEYDASNSGVTQVDNDERVSIVGKIYSMLNTDGEEVQAALIYNSNSNAINGVVITSRVKNYFDNLGINPGDLIRCQYNTNRNNEIQALEVVYKQNSSVLENGDVKTHVDFDTQYRAVLGRIYKKWDNVIDLLPYNVQLTSSDTEIANNIFSYRSDTYTIFRYDSARRIVENLSYQELLDYVGAGESYDKIVVNTRYANPRTIFIVE